MGSERTKTRKVAEILSRHTRNFFTFVKRLTDLFCLVHYLNLQSHKSHALSVA